METVGIPIMKYELWNDGALLETFDTLDAAKVARCIIRFHKGYKK